MITFLYDTLKHSLSPSASGLTPNLFAGLNACTHVSGIVPGYDALICIYPIVATLSGAAYIYRK